MGGRKNKQVLWLPATVSLRGLRIARSDDVPDEFRGQLVSWGDLNVRDSWRTGRGFARINADGVAQLHNGNEVLLSVGDNRAVFDIACRRINRYFYRPHDQIRFFRRFSISADELARFRRARVIEHVVFGFVIAGLWIGGIVAIRAVRSQLPFETLEPESMEIDRLLAVAVMFMVTAVIGWACWRFFRRHRPFTCGLRSFHVSERGLVMRTTAGRTLRYDDVLPSGEEVRRRTLEYAIDPAPLLSRASRCSTHTRGFAAHVRQPWELLLGGIVIIPFFASVMLLMVLVALLFPDFLGPPERKPMTRADMIEWAIFLVVSFLFFGFVWGWLLREYLQYRNGYRALRARERAPRLAG